MEREQATKFIYDLLRALIAKKVEPSGMTVEQLDDYYKPENYSRGLYG